MKKFVADGTHEGQRVDVFLAESIEILSRSSIQKLCDMGLVTLNGKTAQPSDRLKAADNIHVAYNPEKQFKYPKITLPVVYKDDDCIVINKPVGILSHSKGNFNPEATVATWLADKVNGLAGERNGIVHRLDRATSGIMICGLNQEALSWLQKQFSQRKVKKTYIAIVEGKLKTEEAVIDMPIERNPKAPATFRVGPNGKSALTKYKVLQESDKYSLLELKPETGRTHQLRVHLAKLGHPIVGDTVYGGEPAERLFLHALELEITLPSKDRQTFQAPLPSIFKKLMKENR